MRSICLIIFLCFCRLHSKDLFFELEGEFPDRSMIKIEYQDKFMKFSPQELVKGVERKCVCHITFFSNIKDPLKILLHSKGANKNQFFFSEQEKDRKIVFHLFNTKNHSIISNNDVIFSQENIKEPVKKSLSLGVQIPVVSQHDILSGALSAQFSVILKHIG
ncbi:MAG: hypothetical protein S4CHLAM20_01850 [Chlamydiia bacterium]|nr:hypothetical protein [Chlamydiia bacterium]